MALTRWTSSPWRSCKANLCFRPHGGSRVHEDSSPRKKRGGASSSDVESLPPLRLRPPGSATQEANAAAAADPETDAEVWVLAEPVSGHRIGEEVSVPAGAPSLDKRALIRLQGSDGKERIVMAAQVPKGDDRVVAEDVRTMSVIYMANGDRGRNFGRRSKNFGRSSSMISLWSLGPATNISRPSRM